MVFLTDNQLDELLNSSDVESIIDEQLEVFMGSAEGFWLLCLFLPFFLFRSWVQLVKMWKGTLILYLELWLSGGIFSAVLSWIAVGLLGILLPQQQQNTTSPL